MIRSKKFSFDDVDHYNSMFEVWYGLRGKEDKLDKISKRWTEIGFQGTDPSTDFRGMGLLGLVNLQYDKLQNILKFSQYNFFLFFFIHFFKVIL